MEKYKDISKDKMGAGKVSVQVSEFPSMYKWDIIVAFDIGTSYSGYAYSDKKEFATNTINLNEWTGNYTFDPKAKAPTTVLLNEDQTFDSFGFEAEERYAQKVKENTHDKCYRFRNFKMNHNYEKNITEAFHIPDDRRRIFLPAIVIFAHTITALKTHFENAAEDRGVVFKPENVLYVLTVPAIWSESAKEFMKKAAIKAGIAEYQILLALESEVAVLYCKTLPDRMLNAAFNPGTQHIVFDVGGRTINIVVYKIMEDGTMAEVYKASDYSWGGTIVDAQFKEIVNGLFGNNEYFEKLHELAPLDALEFERNFEAKKRQICSNTRENIRLQIPPCLMCYANTVFGNEHMQLLTFASMYVQNEHFKSFFTIAKDRIIGILKVILKEMKTVDFIIMVGGFSSSKFLTDEIKNTPAFSSIRFISPNEPATAVLRGAVLFGYHPRSVSARMCSIPTDFDSKNKKIEKMASPDKIPIQVPNNPSMYDWDIIVAIDIGTSYSGYAYSDKKQFKDGKINLNEWTGNFNYDKTSKAPSIVLLNEDRSFNSFGYEAEANYAKKVKDKTHLRCYRFRNFKMRLYHEKNIKETFEIQDDRRNLSVPAIDIFERIIRVLKSHFENTVKDCGSVYKDENVLYVLTVPAIWSESAKEFMKKAAIKAEIAEHQILLALEPEAAALYCSELQEHMFTPAFKRGTKYMVLDMGGGTIDTVVHKIMEDGTLAEVYKASGGDWGGTIVDAEFKAFVTELFNNEQCIDELWQQAPRDALEFERDFEAKKRQISCDSSLDDIRLQIPNLLKMLANTETQTHNKPFTLEYIYVEQTQFQGFFKTAKKEIIRIIEKIIAEIESIDFIILVGGFSCSEFLRDSIKCHPAFSTIKVISPPEPGTVVLQGAVKFGYSPRSVSARICRYSYGIRVLMPFCSKIHPQSKLAIIDGDEACKDVFHALVYKGELLKYDEERLFKGVTRHRNQDRKFSSIKIMLYEAKNFTEGQLAFVTDEGFRSVGNIVCKPPENGWPDTVNYTVKIYFGQTNIRIETYETANKVPIKTSFELD